VRYFGSAEDDGDFGAQAADDADDLLGDSGVPDVDAEAEDAGWGLDQLGGDFEGGLLEVELADGGAGAEFAEVGGEAAEAEGRVGVAGVDGSEEDFGFFRTHLFERFPVVAVSNDAMKQSKSAEDVELEKGQLWKMEDDTHLQVVMIGKHLVHFKRFRNQKRVPTMLKAIREVQEFLRSRGAVLVESPQAKAS